MGTDRYESLRQFGTVLRQARRERGLSARRLAEQSELSAVYLLTLETGVNRRTGRPSQPSPEIVERLAQTLNIDPDSFLTLAGYTPSTLPIRAITERSDIPLAEMRILDEAVLSLNAAARLRLTETGALILSDQIQKDDLSRVYLGIETAEAYKQAALEVAQVKERLSLRLAEINQRLRGAENG